jgi:hypothetical protein
MAYVGAVTGSAGSWKPNFVVSATTGANIFLFTDATPAPTHVTVAAPSGIFGFGNTMAQLVRDFVGWWTRA